VDRTGTIFKKCAYNILFESKVYEKQM